MTGRTAWIRLGAAAVALPILLNLSGFVPLAPLAPVEHLVISRLMGLGYRLDEGLRGGRPATLVLVGLLAAGWCGAMMGRSEGRPAVLARGLLLALQAAVLIPLVLFAWAVQPLWLLAIGAIVALAVRFDRGRRPERAPPIPGTGVAVLGAGLSLVCLVFIGNLLATHSDGTLWDTASNAVLTLDLGAPARLALTAVVVLFVAGVTVWLDRQGAPMLPDPGRGGATAARGLVPLAIVSFAVIRASLLLDIPNCSSAEDPGIRQLAATAPAYDLAVNAEGVLATVQREAGALLLLDVATGRELKRIPLEGGDPEDIVVLPDSGDFLATVVADEGYAMSLARIDGGTLEASHPNSDGLCWVSSLLWDPTDAVVLMGCEDRPTVHRYRPADGSLLPPVKGLGGDREDMALDGARDRLISVSLMHSDRMTAQARTMLTEEASARIGGGNYAVELDAATDRVFVSRFYDGVVAVFGAGDLEREATLRVGFGVRPLQLLAEQRVLAAASMFRSDLVLFDVDRLEVRQRLHLGGRVKGLAADPAGRRLYVSSACGVFEINPSAL